MEGELHGVDDLLHPGTVVEVALVAGIAGLGYGLLFHYSGRLSLAIALHLAVNLLHLLLLSYPLRLQ